MSARALRRQRHVRMAWLVKIPPHLRGTPKKGRRPFILFLWSDGTSEDATPRRRIERNRERGRSHRPDPRPSPWLIRANAYARKRMAQGFAV